MRKNILILLTLLIGFASAKAQDSPSASKGSSRYKEDLRKEVEYDTLKVSKDGWSDELEKLYSEGWKLKSMTTEGLIVVLIVEREIPEDKAAATKEADSKSKYSWASKSTSNSRTIPEGWYYCSDFKVYLDTNGKILQSVWFK